MSLGGAVTDGRGSGYEEQILRSLRRIIRAVDIYSRKLMAEHGLSGPQLLCLRQLAARDELLSGELAKAISLSPATVTGILDRLESRGLVLRERRVEDKRTVVIRLTAAGRELTEQAPSPLQDEFLVKLRALPDRRQASICHMLKTLVSMMSADDLDAAPLLAADEPMGPAGHEPRQGTPRQRTMEKG